MRLRAVNSVQVRPGRVPDVIADRNGKYMGGQGGCTESRIVDKLGSAEILLFEGFRLDRRGGVLYQLDKGDTAVPVRLGSRAIGLLGLLHWILRRQLKVRRS